MKKYIDVDVDEITKEDALELYRKKGATKIRIKTIKLINRAVENIKTLHSEYDRCHERMGKDVIEFLEGASKISPINYLNIETIYVIHLNFSNIVDEKLDKLLKHDYPPITREMASDFVESAIDIEEDLEELYRILRLLEKADKQKTLDKIRLEMIQVS